MHFSQSDDRMEAIPARVIVCPCCGDILVANQKIPAYRCLNAECPSFDRWVTLREVPDA